MGKKLVFDYNEPNLPHDPKKISEIERVHCDHEVKEMRSYRTLGVLFDEHLTLNNHVKHLISKLNRGLFMINRVKNLLPCRALKSIYYALFHSHLLYCPIILSCTSNSNIEKIFKIQKKPFPQSPTHHTMHTLPHFLHIIKFSHTLLSSNKPN
jgi:hypothetical protein